MKYVGYIFFGIVYLWIFAIFLIACGIAISGGWDALKKIFHRDGY